MSRHFKKNEFDQIYKIYETKGKESALNFMKELDPKLWFIESSSLKDRLRKIVSYYNLGMEDQLITKSGSKRKPGGGRKRKITWDDFTRDELVDIAKRYQEINGDLGPIKKKSEWNLFPKINDSKLSFVLGYCRQTISKWRKKGVLKTAENNIPHKDIIVEEFNKNKGIYGRRRLSQAIKNIYSIDINERSLGRYMSELGLITKTRQKKKARENKDLNSNIEDIVKRDYNDKDSRNIYATDVTYIKAPYDLKHQQNHVYLSAIIEHKTKKIIDVKISRNNDLSLVLSNVKSLETKDKKSFIIHSDHGSQYTSKEYINLIEKNSGKVSLSRLGNSLDNREIEYWFSNLKSECLHHINYKTTSFDELKIIIADYVKWYNENRIQSKLNWKTPQEYSAMLNS